MEYLNKGEVAKKHRLIILTDIECEPDDSQTMVRLLMYSNEIDIEGLIAVTSRWLQFRLYEDSIYNRVHAYGIVRENLKKHAKGWPTKESLLKKIGRSNFGYGMDSVGEGMSCSGSRIIINALDKDDERPIWFAINAGASALAQALYDLRATRSKAEVERLVSKIRVYDDAGQDNCGAWICHEFPSIFYIRSKRQVFGFNGPDLNTGPQPWGEKERWKDDDEFCGESLQEMNQWKWAEINIRTNHGILGALYPQRMFEDGSFSFMDGGGSTCLMGLANKGLYEPEQITWGGWGGRFLDKLEQVDAGQNRVMPTEEKYRPFLMYPQASDTWEDNNTIYENNIYAPVFRWREAYTNDFKARMDWCVKEYGEANHHPIAAFYDDMNRTVVKLLAKAEEVLKLDASKSYDPDGDSISFKWYVYKEAGTYINELDIVDSDKAIASLALPKDSVSKQIHIILEVKDNNCIANLTSYRRIVIDVID